MLLPGTFGKRGGAKSMFVGKWQAANGGQGFIPCRWFGRRVEHSGPSAVLDDVKLE